MSVATYNEEALSEAVALSKKTNAFLENMESIVESERAYAKFKEEYIEIESDISALLLINKARKDNWTTINMIEILQWLWVDNRKTHEAENTLSDKDLINQRSDNFRVFDAIIAGEKGKPQGR